MTDETDIDALRTEVENLRRLLVEGLMVQNGAQIAHLFQNHFGHQATSLLALSFIIEKLGVSVDDIEKRFADVRRTLGPNYATPHVDVMVAVVLNALKTAYGGDDQKTPTRSWTPQVIDGGA